VVFFFCLFLFFTNAGQWITFLRDFKNNSVCYSMDECSVFFFSGKVLEFILMKCSF